MPRTPRAAVATQAVMGRVLDALARLLAPILAFTADEAWEFSGTRPPCTSNLSRKPTPPCATRRSRRTSSNWLELRGVIAQAIEPARQEKIIGNALEARLLWRSPKATSFTIRKTTSRNSRNSSSSAISACRGRRHQGRPRAQPQCQMRALLAISTRSAGCRAPRFVRSLRGGRELPPSPRLKFPLLIALPLYALDQATKFWIVRHFELDGDASRSSRILRPRVLGNTGAAFSAFNGKNAFFTLLSAAALIGLLFFWARGGFREPLSRWGVGLLWAASWETHRSAHPPAHVVDFLLFNLHIPLADPWPAFNVADSCICIAVGLFLIASFRESQSPNRVPDAGLP